MKRLSLILLLALTGCFTRPVSVSVFPKKSVSYDLASIPNFDIVDLEKGIYRGGQPNKQQFELLKKQGVQYVLKLNEDTEGSDAEAELAGLTVIKIPISLREQWFGPVPTAQVRKFWVEHPENVYVHCEHGQDRTGWAVFIYRRLEGVKGDVATQEMLSHGFHKILGGLWKDVELYQ